MVRAVGRKGARKDTGQSRQTGRESGKIGMESVQAEVREGKLRVMGQTGREKGQTRECKGTGTGEREGTEKD